MRSINVTNCQECPFCNDDNEYGKYQCNLSDITADWRQGGLPSNNIHEDCPIENESVTVYVR